MNENNKESVFVNKIYIGFITFIIAFTVRLLLIFSTPKQNDWIDLSIYRDGGQLMVEGVNPYDFGESIELRNKLRLDSISYHPWLSQTQDRWNNYASSNLPLSMIYYGVVENLAQNNPIIYRIVFSFFDSLLSLFVVIILLRFWNTKRLFPDILLILGICALSPTLLLWGTVFPEDKGLQILFMLFSLYFAKGKRWVSSSVFLGCSIAFKGLGVFLFPICLFFILGEPEKYKNIKKTDILRGLYFLLLSIVFAGIWFIPYIPEVLQMILTRMLSNIGNNVEPEHGSIWIFLKNAIPANWTLLKNIFIVSLLFLWSYLFVYKKLNIPAMSLLLLVIFVDIMLLKGSMDRMNIGVIVSAVGFSFVDSKFSKLLAFYLIIFGCLLYINLIYNIQIVESIDALYTLGYTLLFCAYPIFYWFKEIKNK